MKLSPIGKTHKLLILLQFFALFAPSANAEYSANSIEEYNKILPYWGTSWSADRGSVGGYHPSFYTGFAPRSETAERIHVRHARGNQTRVSVILDEQTIIDYLFDLVARDSFYNDLQTQGKLLPIAETLAIPHVKLFSQVVNSPKYEIKKLLAQASSGELSPEQLYLKSLPILSQFNPGRVFAIDLNLTSEFLKWRQFLRSNMQGSNAIENSDNLTMAIESLVLGRINYTASPNKEVKDLIKKAIDLTQDENQTEFLVAAKELFLKLTGAKYQFKTVVGGQLVPALQCSNVESCKLVYPEFTTVYPTGTAKMSVNDKFGNSISAMASPGLWTFFKHRSGRGVDNIRDEPYYGWIPKMDYEAIGNGFHNPGLRFFGIPSNVKTSLNIPSTHSTLWAVKRGAVSHGCSRLASGHAWELRHLLPVIDSEVNKVHVFINKSEDFDLYDVDGDGDLEVMGVEYLIRYDARSSDRREVEGGGFEMDASRKEAFYEVLYGRKNVFSFDGQVFSFSNPSISLQSYRDMNKKRVNTSLQLNGNFPLYEQKYEKDKIQFYRMDPSNEPFIQIMGRVKGSAPANLKSGDYFTNKSADEFEKQAKRLGL